MAEHEEWDHAKVERGKISSVEGDKYAVESYGRQGVITPPIPAQDGKMKIKIGGVEQDAEFRVLYESGDEVYFYLFDDGEGRILNKM